MHYVKEINICIQYGQWTQRNYGQGGMLAYRKQIVMVPKTMKIGSIDRGCMLANWVSLLYLIEMYVSIGSMIVMSIRSWTTQPRTTRRACATRYTCMPSRYFLQTESTLMGQCHKIFDTFLSKNSTQAPYELAKTVQQIFFVFAKIFSKNVCLCSR